MRGRIIDIDGKLQFSKNKDWIKEPLSLKYYYHIFVTKINEQTRKYNIL